MPQHPVAFQQTVWNPILDPTTISRGAAMLTSLIALLFDFRNGIYQQTRTRTNLLLRSQDLSNNTAWSPTGLTAVGGATAPDGSATATTVTVTAAASTYPNLAEYLTIPFSQPFTFSAWLKGSGTVSMDLSGSGGNGRLIVTLTPQWTRYSVAVTSGSSGAMGLRFIVYPTDTATSFSVWGAQLEAAPAASAYIPTTSAPVSVTDNVTDQLANLYGYTYSRSGATKLETEFLGYGDELVANGTFDTDTSGWTAITCTLSSTAGRLRITSTGSAYPGAYQAVSTVVGTTYKFSVQSYTDPMIVRVGTGVGDTSYLGTSTIGLNTVTFTATTTQTFITLYINGSPASGVYVEFDNVSVQQVYPQVTTTTLGAELVTNGTFDTGIAGWTALNGTVQWDGVGSLSCRGDLVANSTAQQTVTTAPGKIYRATWTASGAGQVFFGSTSNNIDLMYGNSTNTAGAHTVDFTATTTASYLQFRGLTTNVLFDNISIKEVLHDGLSYLGPEQLESTVISGTGWQSLYGGVISGNYNTFGGQYSLVDNSRSNIIAGRTYKFDITARLVSGNANLHLFHENAVSGDFDPITLTSSFVTYSATVVAKTNILNVGIQDRNASGWGQIEVQSASLKEVIPEAFITFPSNTPGIVPKVGYYSRAAVTNLLLQSQAFDDAVWGKTNSTISANSALAPDGTLTMDKMVEDATTNQHQMLQTSGSLTSGSVYTISIYGKAGERPRTAIYEASFTGLHATFDWSTGTVVETTGAAIISAKMQSIVGGIYRASITFTAGGTGTTNFVLYMLAAGLSGPVAYAGDGTSGVYLWQAQLVAGSQPGPIIPTTSATATVGADAMSINVPVGSYNFVYTLGDGSVVTVPTVISTGSFSLPTFPGGIATPVIRSLTAATPILTLLDRAGAAITDSAGNPLTTRY